MVPVHIMRAYGEVYVEIHNKSSNLTFRGPCIVSEFLLIYFQQDATLHSLFLENCSGIQAAAACLKHCNLFKVNLPAHRDTRSRAPRRDCVGPPRDDPGREDVTAPLTRGRRLGATGRTSALRTKVHSFIIFWRRTLFHGVRNLYRRPSVCVSNLVDRYRRFGGTFCSLLQGWRDLAVLL